MGLGAPRWGWALGCEHKDGVEGFSHLLSPQRPRAVLGSLHAGTPSTSGLYSHFHARAWCERPDCDFPVGKQTAYRATQVPTTILVPWGKLGCLAGPSRDPEP